MNVSSNPNTAVMRRPVCSVHEKRLDWIQHSYKINWAIEKKIDFTFRVVGCNQGATFSGRRVRIRAWNFKRSQLRPDRRAHRRSLPQNDGCSCPAVTCYYGNQHPAVMLGKRGWEEGGSRCVGLCNILLWTNSTFKRFFLLFYGPFTKLILTYNDCVYCKLFKVKFQVLFHFLLFMTEMQSCQKHRDDRIDIWIVSECIYTKLWKET